LRLDSTTPLGLEAIYNSKVAVSKIQKKTNYDFVWFSDELPSIADGIILKNNVAVALYEVKSRNISSEELFGNFNGEWLISYDKIHELYNITKHLRVSFVGILYCIKDDVSLAATFWDGSGAMKIKWRVEQTKTRKTVNGGEAERPNAFFDMTRAIKYT